MTRALHEFDAGQLSERYASGELSPVDVVRALLDRIAAWEPALNAMYRLRSSQALEEAAASEARWRERRPRSPLDGVPVTVKENIATRGDPMPIGTRANEDARPEPEDSPPAARLREAGCVLLGKTTMPDFGMLSSGLSSLHGITRNPWQADRNPSGSSSGAAAACAAGYAPLHVGTDIGGSIRLPATHCGLFGLKPSYGRVPIQPPYLGRVAGPITRTAEDAARLLNALARPDARDFASLPWDPSDWTRGTLGRLRIGFLPDMRAGMAVHPEAAAAARQAAESLARDGAEVVEIESFMTPGHLDGVCRFFESRSENDLAAMTPERRAKVLPFIVEWCTWRAAAFTGREVMRAYNAIVALREAAVRACEPFDFVLSPVSPILPYEAELPAPGNDPRDALPHIAFTVAYNMSGQPAASVPWCSSAGGLPIGVQVVGRRFDDRGVLALSRRLERLRPAQRPWPEPGLVLNPR